MLEVKQILKQASYGATKPLFIIASDNKQYILKFRNSSDYEEEKDLHIFNEYLGYELIKLLDYGIAPQKLELIKIDETTLELAKKACKNEYISYEALNYLEKSFGTNIAVEYLENTEKANENEINIFKFKNETMHIDNFILNNDRNTYNTNILKDLNYKNKFYVIDFGLAFLDNRIYESISNNNLSSYYMCLNTCNALTEKRYIFSYNEIQFTKSKINNIRLEIERIVNSCPSDWAMNKYKKDIIEILCNRIDSKLIFENSSCPMELY